MASDSGSKCLLVLTERVHAWVEVQYYIAPLVALSRGFHMGFHYHVKLLVAGGAINDFVACDACSLLSLWSYPFLDVHISHKIFKGRFHLGLLSILRNRFSGTNNEVIGNVLERNGESFPSLWL